MLTQGMEHQLTGVERLQGRSHYGLACEQGTGKTWMLLADAELDAMAGDINGMLVIAPKGVHANWVLREIPTHMQIPTLSHYYLSGAGVRRQRQLEHLLNYRGDDFPILTMNVDALNTKNGFNAAMQFLKRFDANFTIDESQRIKNPTSGRSKKAFALANLATRRRISSGTMIANSPLDAYGQFHFLRPGLLGTKSYRAFVAEYAELLPEGNPIVEGAKARAKGGRGNPQIIARDPMGRPRYRNVDKLTQLIAPHCYRVTKKECLDLPDKIYKVHYFHLNKRQQAVYDAIANDARMHFEDGHVDTYTALTLINKLRQVTAGFIMTNGEAVDLDPDPDRMAALRDLVEDVEGKAIIWAAHKAEIRMIADWLFSQGEEVVEYHGGISNSQREEAIDRFQNGTARWFVANEKAGGTGLTLTAAETSIYYSSDFDLDSRLQSEDRNHRIGTKHNVVYIDLCAVGTVDERVAAALQSKKQTALQILDGL